MTILWDHDKVDSKRQKVRSGPQKLDRSLSYKFWINEKQRKIQNETKTQKSFIVI